MNRSGEAISKKKEKEMINFTGPIGKYLATKELTTNQASRMTGLSQPTLWRHSTGKTNISIEAMEVYNSVFKISFKAMRNWNKQRKEQHE